MTEAIQAIDVSNYTGELSTKQIDAFKAAGIAHVVVRLSLETFGKRAIAVQQLRACVAAGLTVSGYLWVYSDTSPADVDAAVAIAAEAGAQLTILWLDVEEDGPTVEQIRALADRALAAGCRAGIYTGRWWWRGHFGNPADAADLPLWDANYGLGADLDADPGYGGWTQRAGHQYVGTSTVGGVRNVDLNVFRPEVATLPTAPTSPDVETLERELWAPLWGLKEQAWALGRSALGDAILAAVIEDKHRAGLS